MLINPHIINMANDGRRKQELSVCLLPAHFSVELLGGLLYFEGLLTGCVDGCGHKTMIFLGRHMQDPSFMCQHRKQRKNISSVSSTSAAAATLSESQSLIILKRCRPCLICNNHFCIQKSQKQTHMQHICYIKICLTWICYLYMGIAQLAF